MRSGPVVCLAFAAVLAVTPGPAVAESCAGLPATTFLQLTPKQQSRFDGGEAWGAHKSWKFMRASIVIERAPHLAKRILEDCPGVRVSGEVYPEDERRFRSSVEVVVTSYAAALRLARLSAIVELALYDATPRKHPPPRRHVHVEPPLLELD